VKQPKSRKRDFTSSPFAPAGVCLCCGRFIVLLKTKPYGRLIACYFKGWDGNPWYSGPKNYGGNACPHPKNRYAKYLEAQQENDPNQPDSEPSDPFFQLP